MRAQQYCASTTHYIQPRYPRGFFMLEKKMIAGEPFVIRFKIRRNKLPADITGMPAKIELRDKSPEGPVITEWDDASTEITRDDLAGLVTLSLPASYTNTQKFKEAYTDLLIMNDSNGLRSALIKVTLHRGATR